MEKEIKAAIVRGYMRRGLISVYVSDQVEQEQRRINFEQFSALYIVPWAIIEDKRTWAKSKKKFLNVVEGLYDARKEEARRRWEIRTTK